jgi:hypothetical protein
LRSSSLRPAGRRIGQLRRAKVGKQAISATIRRRRQRLLRSAEQNIAIDPLLIADSLTFRSELRNEQPWEASFFLT